MVLHLSDFIFSIRLIRSLHYYGWWKYLNLVKKKSLKWFSFFNIFSGDSPPPHNHCSNQLHHQAAYKLPNQPLFQWRKHHTISLSPSSFLFLSIPPLPMKPHHFNTSVQLKQKHHLTWFIHITIPPITVLFNK